MHRSRLLFGLIWTLLCTGSYAADWAQFRGPGGNGASPEVGLPTKWSSKENIAWRLELPGLGTSSPIVVGQKAFVTCYSGYAETAENPGDSANLKRHVVCVDRLTGKILWTKDVAPSLPESNYEDRNDIRHGYSSSTPASDGRYLYVFFGKTGVFCYTLSGEQVWQTKVGDGIKGWGSSNSPVLFENLVIINASVESGDLVALDKQTGTEKWRATGTKGSWNTPALVRSAEGTVELIISLPQKVLGLDPTTGKELWHCEGIPDGYVCPSVVSHEGVIYLIEGDDYRTNASAAIQDGQILLRNDKYLYCIGKRRNATGQSVR